MQENYEHYISRNIKALYRKRLAGPILYLLFTAILWTCLPIHPVLSPTMLTSVSDMQNFHKHGEVYVSSSIKDLKFTGYTKTRFGKTIGYYYYLYNTDKNECCIVLLSPTTCEQGLPQIDEIFIRGKILYTDAHHQTLLSNLSEDLDWTTLGIRTKVSSYYLSEPDFRYFEGLLLVVVLAASSTFALISIILSILYILRPDFSPPCRVLRAFGRPKELLALAEEELATLPQLATEDMFITEHFFIEISRYGIALVPIQEIIWIYKHSTLHKLFWYHFSISYTLSITANNHIYIHCPKNIKSDIDGIIDYLSEANHDILVGFNEANRRKIQAIQGDPFHFERLIALLKKRI
ncbi:MAG: hypothetical protein J6A92_01675 [Lachnospiraceae bacterium]|nr:hypothetical protein [Lachnospiraceae bacterium]